LSLSAMTLRAAQEHDQVRRRRRSLAAHRPQSYDRPQIGRHHRAHLHAVQRSMLCMVWAVRWHRRRLREAVQGAVARDFSRATSTSSSSTTMINEGGSSRRPKVLQQQPGLKLSTPPAHPAPCPRAEWSPLPPSQVARSSPPSPTMAMARWLGVVGPLLPPLPPPRTPPLVAEVSRARCACAERVYARDTCTCISLLTMPD
jgi:hypothetical protein